MIAADTIERVSRARPGNTSSVRDALSCLEGRWKMMILAQLFGDRPLRFSDLQRAIPRVSQKMLIQQLRALETDGILKRTVYPEVPPRVEYQLTAMGRALYPAFTALFDWAEMRRERRPSMTTQ